MHWTRTPIPTLKETPSDANGIAEQLLLRAGLARRTGTGRIAFLPLGFLALNKMSDLLREGLKEAEFFEVFLGSESSEMTAAETAARCMHSYKQLPLRVFQISPGESGELLLQANCFADSSAALDRCSNTVRDLIQRLFARCKVSGKNVKSAGSEQLVVFSPDGANEVFVNDSCSYAASVDAAETGARSWAFAGEPSGPLEKIHTPGLTSVDHVSKFLRVKTSQVLKTLVFEASSSIQVNWVVAVVRGDHQVNAWKLSQAALSLGVSALRLADSPALREEFAVGFVGPDAGTKTPDAVLVIDPDAAQGEVSWIAGANEVGYHVRNFNWFREAGDRLADPTKVLVADVRNAIEGDPAPTDGTLRCQRAITLADIRSLGTAPCEAAGVLFDDGTGSRRPLHAGSYRLSLISLIRAIVENSHDELGIIWPAAVAPCSVVLTPIQYDGDVRQAADRLYTQLTFEGIDTILDDRDVRAGFKFADADLAGFPIRINIGQKNLAQGLVEMKRRTAARAETIPLDQVVARVRAALVEL